MLAEIILEKLYEGTKMSRTDIVWICQSTKRLFLEQPNLLELQPPVTICGDTHGQFRDTCRLFQHCGDPSVMNYLFLGDYVDRGNDGIENVSLLFLYKILYPENFFILRGNHECGYVSRQFGFYDECVKKYDEGVWKLFVEVFNCMPVAAIIADNVFCVHGGISPHLKSLQDIDDIKRPTEVPSEGLLCDLLWSDPGTKVDYFGPNERGKGVVFGLKAFTEFKKKFKFDLMIRAHQAIYRGFDFPFEEKAGLITIFSATNYCDSENYGGMVLVDKNLKCYFKALAPILGEEEEEEEDTKGKFKETLDALVRYQMC